MKKRNTLYDFFHHPQDYRAQLQSIARVPIEKNAHLNKQFN